MRLRKWLILITCVVFSSCDSQKGPFRDGRINDCGTLVKEFKNPGSGYRPAPLWVWNNKVSKEDIELSLAELKEQGIGGVFFHPRRGLITEYLSEEWFYLVAFSMKKARELDLKVWIYDENVCPSGFAGGHVYNEMPASYKQGTSLLQGKMKRLDLSDRGEQKVKFVFKKEGEAWINITDMAKKDEGKNGDHAVIYLRNFRSGNSNYANFSYVDLIAEGVSEKFMEVTMKGYEKGGSHEFGELIPGIFTDEPQIGSEGGLIYTPDHLYPGGSFMVYVHRNKVVESATKPEVEAKKEIRNEETTIEKLHPNVLTIDYVDLNLMGEDKGSMYYARASGAIYKRFGYSLVPYLKKSTGEGPVSLKGSC